MTDSTEILRAILDKADVCKKILLHVSGANEVETETTSNSSVTLNLIGSNPLSSHPRA